MKTALEKLEEWRILREKAAKKKRKTDLEKVWEEKLVAKWLVRCVEEAGGIAFKMHPLTNKGIPDYLIIMRGRTFFVETKTTGKVCTPAQVEFHRLLKDKKVDTYVLDTKITNFYDLYTLGYKTYVDPNDSKYGVNKERK